MFSTPTALNKFCPSFPCSPSPPSLSTDWFQLGLCSLPLSSAWIILWLHFMSLWEFQGGFTVNFKNCEGSKFCHPCKLTCELGFTAVGRRHETPGSERGGSLSLRAIAEPRVSSFCSVSWAQFPQGEGKRAKWQCAPRRLHYRRGTRSLGNLILLYWAIR